VVKGTAKASKMNSSISVRVISAQTWLAGVLVFLAFPNAFAESDFSAFWKRFKSAAIAGDKAAVVEMTKFPVSMSYGVKAVKNKENFLRRYDEIFKGGVNAAQCFVRRNREKSRRSGMRSTVLSRKLRTTWKTRHFVSSSN